MITILLTKIIALLTSIANKPFLVPEAVEYTDFTIDSDTVDDGYNVKVYVYGDIVYVYYTLISNKITIPAAGENVIMSGLPKENQLLLFPLHDPVKNYDVRVRLENGTLKFWRPDNSISSERLFQGYFCYVKAPENESEVTP